MLTEPTWRAAPAAHEARVDAATAAHLRRRSDGRKHPVEDFLFTYYSFKPAQLRRWHPGAGVGLAAGGTAPQRDWRHYTLAGDVVSVDAVGFVAARSDTLRFVRDLLVRTASRPGRFGCFGLHEWAMVYRQTPEDVRHADYPLRLGSEGTDAVVESHQIACSHFDAFRFFTPPAVPRNALSPTRAGQAASEQPGCLHAGMDLYKWAHKLVPAVRSDLVMDCFDLAREIRALDMRAAPYNLRELGYEPLLIETPEGKAQYAAEQRGFAARGLALRTRLVEAIDQVWLSAGLDPGVLAGAAASAERST
ncbi:3-methyladenine DNA glycosylase [Humibacillus sp. DSM 29435]|uniref:3-methyladenine DNA glycosylase n=1 Tax=Humibacillus sp. DSM 29435 TaxID=1869167 RepID=UPI000872E954|nr:3-methyladenine DNA glycosylase [Humibacillus sp. DSM 29435]OFE16873.1 3-methyladenine DNA glycosylase [Humibacillus sp. DSM 29435]